MRFSQWRSQAHHAVSAGRCFLLLCVLAAVAGCPDRSTPATEDATPYTLGTTLRFGRDGDGAKFLGAGWSAPEAGHTWSDKTTAVIAMRVQSAEGPLKLEMRMNGLHKAPQLPAQRVELQANGTKVAEWQVAEETEHSAEIPANLMREGGALRLELKIPDATTPKELGMGADERVLGVSLHTLRLTRAEK
jgi:hypothetical protein